MFTAFMCLGMVALVAVYAVVFSNTMDEMIDESAK